jgi:hypothetical protein
MMDEKTFDCGIVYSAAWLINAHGEHAIAKELLDTAGDIDYRCCSEYDNSILREYFPDIPKGEVGQ